jgi:hypothetical protein
MCAREATHVHTRQDFPRHRRAWAVGASVEGEGHGVAVSQLVRAAVLVHPFEDLPGGECAERERGR